jgi:hypothetical protein
MFGYMVGTLTGAFLFIAPLWAYRRGLKDGLAINKGKDIEPIKIPVQVIQEVKKTAEQSKTEAKINKQFRNLMEYDGTAQKVED